MGVVVLEGLRSTVEHFFALEEGVVVDGEAVGFFVYAGD
jgi:hypothetical protein